MNDLLNKLNNERNKFTQSDRNKMQNMIDILLGQGIYHTPLKLTVLEMVENYGAYWYLYEEPHFCKHCKAVLRGNEPPYKREIGMYNRRLDGVMYYICPDCREEL